MLLKVIFGFLICALLSLSGLESFKLLGGNQITIDKCPYQVSVQKSSQHVCEGAIINKEWVLTAGQCVQGLKESVVGIRAGSSNANSGGVVHKVSEIVIHEQYNANSKANDIALIKVQPPFKIDPKSIDPVNLPLDRESVPPEADAFLTGYGKTSSSSIPTYALQGVTLPTISDNVCKQIVSTISKTMVCAGYTTGGRDACNGDEGSPLVLNKKLIGITSWNFSCGVNSKPTVFTKISEYRSWIKKHANL